MSFIVALINPRKNNLTPKDQELKFNRSSNKKLPSSAGRSNEESIVSKEGSRIASNTLGSSIKK
jgi:hypothetical protein